MSPINVVSCTLPPQLYRAIHNYTELYTTMQGYTQLNLADNYRPISLTSVVVKIVERLIHKHIMKYLTDFQLLNDNQHGFRASRSCVTQLLQLVHEWFQAMDKLASVDAVFLDFAKAFDKVSHAHLYKLECYGIKDQILNWLRDFLTPRKRRVVIEGQASD